jgi:hypothetical protein
MFRALNPFSAKTRISRWPVDKTAGDEDLAVAEAELTFRTLTAPSIGDSKGSAIEFLCIMSGFDTESTSLARAGTWHRWRQACALPMLGAIDTGPT